MFIHDPALGPRRSGTVALTWRQARRQASDPAHTLGRILEGLAMGAGVGIDICPMSDGHFAVLQGPLLDRETTGSGPVVRIRAADLAGLRRRAESGRVVEEVPLTLAALAEAVGAGATGQLRINLRCGDEALRPGHEVGLVRALRPLGDRALLSGHDAMALRRLGDAQPGLRLGYSLSEEAAEWLRRTGDARGFAARVAGAMPEASTIHLSGRAILALDDEDIGVVAAFKEKGWQVEARADGDSGTEPWEILRLVSLGVDRISTGDAEGVIAALAGHRPTSGPGHQPGLPGGATPRVGWSLAPMRPMTHPQSAA